ncbi:hypothetical protein NQ315_002816 [Exocentrus adspersus]|uniref:Carboxypeptidase n=1 Tax=Exocentrus adspersus TaxID=1586481 RepID=A0AAV8VE97_9CUCU|nr:hypothetical protein NQ315_002816 [Exocentrus adspersus]
MEHNRMLEGIESHSVLGMVSDGLPVRINLDLPYNILLPGRDEWERGAVDQKGYEAISEVAERTKAAFEAGNFVEATNLWGNTESAISKYTYGVDFYNVVKKIQSRTSKYYSLGQLPRQELHVQDEAGIKIEALMNGVVKEVLNISREWGPSAGDVFNYLQEDFMKPVTNVVEELLNSTDIKIAVYNGQLDLIVDTPGTLKWVENLNWKEKNEWKATVRRGFTVNNYFEGNMKKFGNLAVFWVDRSGHMVPKDNPAAMRYILADMTDDFKVQNQ